MTVSTLLNLLGLLVIAAIIADVARNPKIVTTLASAFNQALRTAAGK
jgi:hypothetical protein